LLIAGTVLLAGARAHHAECPALRPHRGPCTPGPGRYLSERSAARTVFTRSMATVIGPTPPV
jgi:hypothetical protein